MNQMQNYLTENFIFITMVVSTYFIVSMKSAVDNTIKVHMVVNMSLLLIISISEFHLNYINSVGITGTKLLVAELIFFSIKPLPMCALINMTVKNDIRNYIPAIINFGVYCFYFIQSSEYFITGILINDKGIIAYWYLITEWIYWIIFLFMINIKFYKENSENTFGMFIYISVLMIANIMDSTGLKSGILVKTYAMAFLLYYLIVHVYISQQVNEEKDIKLREQRLSMMLSQIQPHFLYNTLNTITALCRANPKLAEETTVKFSKYLRENMYSMGDKDMHSFEDELEHIKIYLDIEKLRFGDRLNVVYNIQSTDFNVPVLTLQPIVENAVKHGICKRMEGGTVNISSIKRGKDHIITISDDGEGFVPEKIYNDGKPHIGIQNANERLKNTVKTEMEISSFIGVGTEVKIVIPGEKNNNKGKEVERREIHSIGR